MEEHGTGQPPLLPDEHAPADAPTDERAPWFDWHGLLRNRIVLGSMGLLVVLLLVTIVLVAMGGDGDSGSPSAAGPTDEPGAATAVIGPGLQGELLETIGSRNGPGASYAFLGIIYRGTVLSVVGRNADNTWLQVVYPPGGTLRVWVPIDVIDVDGDINDLVIAGPAAGPDIVVPTSAGPVAGYTPLPTEPGGTEIEATPTRSPRPTNTRPPTWTPRPTSTPAPSPTPGIPTPAVAPSPEP